MTKPADRDPDNLQPAPKRNKHGMAISHLDIPPGRDATVDKIANSSRSRLGIRIARLLALVAEIEDDTTMKTRIADEQFGPIPQPAMPHEHDMSALPLFDQLDDALDRLAIANARARDATERLAHP
jgi:hypothetical protein